MATRISNNIRTVVLDYLCRHSDALGGSGLQLEFRTGTQPANSNASPTGTLLCTIMASVAPSFATATSGGDGGTGSSVKAGTWSGTVVADGVVGWCRMFPSASPPSAFNIDVSCGLGGSGADLIFDDTDFVTDGTVVIDSFSLQLPHTT